MDRRGVLRAGGVWAARLVVAGVFLWAAVPKLVDLTGFAQDIRNYQVFPEWALHLLAAVVPTVEVVGAAAMLSGTRGARGAGALLGVLTIGFIALMASVIVRGIDLQCGCFGRDAQAESIGWPTVARDVALLATIALAMFDPVGSPRVRVRASRG